jgi:hypothetical protein
VTHCHARAALVVERDPQSNELDQSPRQLRAREDRFKRLVNGACKFRPVT